MMYDTYLFFFTFFFRIVYSLTEITLKQTFFFFPSSMETLPRARGVFFFCAARC